MSEERRTIEVDTEFLESLYGLVGKIPPGEKNINLDLLKDLMLDIKRKMGQIKTDEDKKPQEPDSQKPKILNSRATMEEEYDESKEAVLVVDDLGVITYQLGVMFRNLGYDVTLAKEIYDAINKFKKRKYKMVVMDLFIPTDREGFLLLDELVKLSKMADNSTIIGVMTASSKKEHRQLCLKKGADFYIEKVDDWQNELVSYCEKG